MLAKKIIVCVCRGNILRSVIAEKLINHQLSLHGLSDNYDVISRSIQGTILDTKPVRYPNLTYYTDVYQRVKPVLDELNVDLTAHVSKTIDKPVVARATHVFAMDKQTYHALITLFPKHTDKISLFTDLVSRDDDVADVPYYIKPTYSIRTIKDIQGILNEGIDNLLTIIRAGKTRKTV